MYFLFLMGMNDFFVVRIYFNEDYEFIKSLMFFMLVKMRVNGKKVKFEI